MPPRKSEHYISKHFHLTFEGVDRLYLHPGPKGGRTACYEKRVWNPRKNSAAFDAYWGSLQNGKFTIGVRGRIIGLCMLHRALIGEERSWRDLAEEIVAATRQSSSSGRISAVHKAMVTLDDHAADPVEGQSALSFEQTTLVGWLMSLIRDGLSRSTPPQACATPLLEIVSGYFAMAAARVGKAASIEEAYAAITELPPQEALISPSSFARWVAGRLHIDLAVPRMYAESPNSVEIDAPAVITSRHYLESAVREYVEVMGEPNAIEPLEASTVTDIRHHLSVVTDQQSRLVVLTGGPHTGKKAIVGDLLRQLPRDADGTRHLPLVRLDGGPGKMLPVFAINARRTDYLVLVLEVLVFLERRKAPLRDGGVPDFDALLEQRLEELGGVGSLSLESLLSKVAKLHADNPTFFVFIDVHGSRRDSILKVVRNYGINRLLRTLFRSCPDSRVLLTDPEGGGTTYELLDGAETPHQIVLEAPTTDRLAWYLPARKEQVAAILEQIPPSRTTGTALIGLAALLGQIESDGPQFGQELRRRVKEIGKNADHATKEIYRDLVEIYERLGCLEALALICASEDGLMESTLERAREGWPESYRGDNWIETSKVLVALDEAAKKSSWMLIRQHKSVKIDADELSFDETTPSTFLEVTRDIREAVLFAMQARPEWKEISLIAHRRIAIAARRRAQIKKMRSSPHSTGGTRNADGRDIQSYAALLASIDPSNLPGPENDRENSDVEPEPAVSLPPASHSLRLSSDLVFTSDERFDARVALRFAVRCQLHEDIDHDFRLSMVSDQDELRLRLYLLPFCALGLPQFWTIESLRQSTALKGIPKMILSHVKSTFTNGEIFELLVTIALSAFHCQFPRMIWWARDRLIDLESHLKPGERLAWRVALTRVRCSQLDMHILRGDDFKSAYDHAVSWREELETEYCWLATNLDERILLKDDLKVLKAWMRLQAREAELIWMKSGEEEPVDEIYSRLTGLENKLADRIDQDDPIILSGRTARRYIKFLTRDAPLFLVDPALTSIAKSKNDPALVLIKHMLETNISRLRRFGGADRVGVLVDISRRYHLERKTPKALGYGDLAVESTFSGLISHGGKIDVLSVNAALHLFEAERHIAASGSIPKIQDHLKKAGERIRLLRALARALHFTPSKALGAYLDARLSVATNNLGQLIDPKRRQSARVAQELLKYATEKARTYGGELLVRQMGHLMQKIGYTPVEQNVSETNGTENRSDPFSSA